MLSFSPSVVCCGAKGGMQAGYLWNKKLLYSGVKKGKLIYCVSSLNDRVGLQPGTGKGELIFRKNFNFYASSSFKMEKMSVCYIFHRSEVFSNAPGNFNGELGCFTKKRLAYFVLTTSLSFSRKNYR